MHDFDFLAWRMTNFENRVFLAPGGWGDLSHLKVGRRLLPPHGRDMTLHNERVGRSKGATLAEIMNDYMQRFCSLVTT